MATHVTREIGQSGPMEEVAYVQALLATVTGKNGRPYWDAQIDGQPGNPLVAAITAFQQADRDAEHYVRLSETGLIRVPSMTLRRLLEFAPRDLRGVTVVADGGRPVIYASGDPYRPGDTVRHTVNAVRHGYTAKGRVLVGAFGDSLARAVETLSERHDLELRLEAVDIVGDKLAARLFPATLSLADPRGRMGVVDGVATRVPPVLWRVIDDAMAREGWERGQVPGWSGEGVYRHRDAVPALARNTVLGDDLFTRFGLPMGGWNSARRVVATALSLIARADTLSSEEARDLGLLKSAIALKDRDLAVRLEERHHAMKGALSAGNLEYRTHEEILEYLKERGEWDRFVDLFGLALILADTADSFRAAVTATATVGARLSGGLGAVLGIFQVMAKGSSAIAGEIEKERQAIARISSEKVAAVSMLPGESRREALLRIFKIPSDQFRVSDDAERRVLSLMEAILQEQAAGGPVESTGMQLTTRIQALNLQLDGHSQPLVNHLMVQYRLMIHDKNWRSTHLLPDHELSMFRRRMDAWSRALSLLGLMKNVTESRHSFLTSAGFLGFVLRTEGDRARDLANRALDSVQAGER